MGWEISGGAGRLGEVARWRRHQGGSTPGASLPGKVVTTRVPSADGRKPPLPPPMRKVKRVEGAVKCVGTGDVALAS